MKCIKVYPILKKTFSESLTYWINENVNIGDIIEVPLQNRKIWVVVDSIVSITEAKEFIKSQSFTIRKIDKIKRLELFSLDFIFSILKTSNYYLRPFGEIFSEIIPKKVLENLSDNIEIKQENINEINIFPIKEYINKELKNSILPIDLYKIDNQNIKIINLHYSESEYYRHLFKKFDYRFILEEFANRKKIKLNKIETKLNLKDKNLFIIDQENQNKTIIKKKNNDGEIYKERLNIISPELFTAIKKIEKNKENIFLYTLKKGLAGSIICPDCHHVLKCGICDNKLELDIKNNKRSYICPEDHKAPSIDTPCPICQNENLLPLGANIDVVYKELKDKTDLPIIKIDNENNTKSEIKKLDKKSTIFIGNDFLLNQLIAENYQFDNTAIISLESLFAIPLYNMEKTIYQKIALIADRTKKNLLIQTRDINNTFWKLKNPENLDELKELKLPPFTTHIQIHVKTEKSKRDLNLIRDFLKKYTELYEDEHKIHTTLHILIDKEKFLKSPINYYLKSLPAYIKVEVDSRNLI